MTRLPFDGSYPLTQGWGENPEAYARYGLPGHNGLDFGIPLLTPLLAPADGELLESDYDAGGFGWYVKLRTPAGEDWLLAHGTHRSGLVVGSWVAEGAYLLCSGTSGNSTGPHVHVGYRPDGTDHGGAWHGWAPPPLLSHPGSQ